MAIDPTALPAGQPQASANPIDPNLYLSTPEGYATPEQLQAARAYAQALQKSSIETPVKSWQQGVSNMVQALVGGNLAYQQGQKEAANQRLRMGAAMPAGMTGGPAAAPQGVPPVPGAPTSGPAPFGKLSALGEGADKSSHNGGSTTDTEAAAITKNESGGKYDAQGPVTKTGDRAYGRYQVMGANIPAWTKEVLGTAMTPDQFLANPLAQDTVFRAKWGQLRAKYGPQGAARAWFAGEGNMNNPNAKDILGTSVASYERKFDASAGLPPSQVAGGAAPTRLAFNGNNPSAGGNPLSDMRAFAGPQGGQQGNGPQGAGPLNGGWDPHPTLPPDSIPVAPIYTRQQIMQRLADPALSDAERRVIVSDYLTQFQPITMKVTGGNVLINRMNPSQQKFIPDIEKAIVEYPGGVKIPAPYITGPYGGSITRLPTVMPPVPGAAPGAAPAPASGGQPGALPFAPTGGAPAPAGGPGAAPAAVPAPGGAPAPANGAPMPPVPGNQGAVTPPPGGPQVASLDPAAGVGEAAKGAPAAPAAAAVAATSGPPTGTAPAPAAGPRIAGLNTPAPAGVPQQDVDTIRFFNQMAVDQEQRKAAATESSKMFSKQYNDMNEATLKVQNEALPRLHRMLAVLDDPNSGVYTGIGADQVLNWQRLKNAWGQLTGDKSLETSGAANELFRKDAAQSVLDALKPATQGTGQIRLAEIHLLERAAASPYNTVAANRAIVQIAIRGAQRLQYFQDMADDYASGNAVVDPLNPKHVLVPANVDRNGEQHARNGIDFGYRKMLSQWIKEHPAYTEEETKNFEKLFDDDKRVKVPKEGAAANGAAGTPPAAGGAPAKAGDNSAPSPPVINDKAAYDALAPGTVFVDGAGKRWTKQ